MSVLLLFAAAVLVGAESIAELKSKASAGDVDAQARLAAAYFQGEGVPEDHAQALRWAAVPAEQDDLFCAQMIAQIHYKGTGVKRDLPAALRWFRNAAILGDSTAALTAGLMMEEGHGVAKNPVEALVVSPRHGTALRFAGCVRPGQGLGGQAHGFSESRGDGRGRGPSRLRQGQEGRP
jgi:hypothetical protein